jgi:hypothetical protein
MTAIVTFETSADVRYAVAFGAKQTTLESKAERGPGGDPWRPVPGVPPRRRRGPRS